MTEIAIPPEALEAAVQAYLFTPGRTASIRAAICAALNAWPGVCVRHRSRPHPVTKEWTYMEPMLSLPLPQEASDE